MNMIDTRNEHTAEIARLNKRIAEHQRLLGSQDSSINELLRSCKDKDIVIKNQSRVINTMSGGHGERIVSENKRLNELITEKDRFIVARWDEISKQREVIERFELTESTIVANVRECNTRMHKTIRAQDATICDMANDIDVLKKKDLQWQWSDGTSEGVVESMISLANDNQMKINVLEGKLADRERQFNELDDILGRTRESMLRANEHIGKQNMQIKEHKSLISLYDDWHGRDLDERKHLQKSLSEAKDIIGHRDARIEELNDKLVSEDKKNRQLRYEIAEKQDNIYSLRAGNGRLLNEIRSYKDDSKVLMKVVDVIKNDAISNLSVPCIICSIVDDYLDTPRSTIDERNAEDAIEASESEMGLL